MNVVNSNNNTNFETLKADVSFYVLLFDEFKKKLPKDLILLDRTIPYHVVRIILARWRYSLPQVRSIIKAWQELGFVHPVKFRGIKLKQQFENFKGEVNEKKL